MMVATRHTIEEDLGVQCDPCNTSATKPDVVTVVGSKRTYEDAELEEARLHNGGPEPMPADDALAAAEREGLTLVRSTTNKTGFKNLQYYKGRNKGRPYQLKLSLDGRTSHIGSYATPEEAALTYARLIGPEARRRLQTSVVLRAQLECLGSLAWPLALTPHHRNAFRHQGVSA